jgi:Protein of unknown function (DUF2917)
VQCGGVFKAHPRSLEMETGLNHKLTDLRRDATLRLRDGHDRVVAVFEGQVWVTQSGDPHDFIVGAGESLALDRPGLAIVQGLRDSRIMVLEPETIVLPSSYELRHQARAQRDAVLGAALSRGFRAAKRALVQAFAHRPSDPPPVRTAWATRA